MRFGWFVVCALAACVRTDTTQCGDEVCPAGTTCASVTAYDGAMRTRCVQPAQLDACIDIDNGMACTFGAGNATCHGGACIPDACGDSLRGSTEACDDENVTSGDGCSSDCRSAEVCGNGVVDPVRLVESMPTTNEQCDDNNFRSYDGCSLCVIERPQWTRVPHRPPRNRGFHSLATDTRRHEVVLFGGADDRGSTPNEIWVWNGESWRARTSDSMPSGRAATGIVYDSARDRIVMFSGSDPSFSVVSRDLWEWDGHRWEERVAAGPSGRLEHAVAYDSLRDVTVVFGGIGQAQSGTTDWLDETWLWNGTTWTLHVPASPDEAPSSRSRAALAFDPVRGETVMFGGSGNTGIPTGQTWLFDGSRWRLAQPAQSPSARTGTSMAWDPTSQRVILFGGLATMPRNDAWAWDGTTWTPIAGGPPARYSSAMATDSERGGVVLYGGVSVAPTLHDTWWFDGAAWHDKTNTFEPAFVSIAAATDTTRDVIVVFGGMNNTLPLDTTLEYVRGSWFQRTPATSPSARRGHQMVYMPSIGKVVVWGGQGLNGAYVNDGTWGWDGTTWQLLATPSLTPGRAEIASTYDAERNEIVMFGGRITPSGDPSSDTWVFDGAAWTQRLPATLPPKRSNATLGYDPKRKRVVMTGGGDQLALLSDLWTWDGTTWTEHPQQTRPSARSGASLVWNSRRERLLLVGGADISSASVDDLWELDDLVWFRASATAPARGQLAFVPTIGGVMRLSGTTELQPLAEMWRLRWEPDGPDEVCSSATDVDGDSLAGCADPDCEERCTGCGDGTCSLLEDCHLCPTDCGACAERCGDATCSQGESASSCPSDC